MLKSCPDPSVLEHTSHTLQNRTVSAGPRGEPGLCWWQPSITERALLVPETQGGGVIQEERGG